MRIFKVELEWKDMDDSWYFKNPPSKENLIQVINEHEMMAGGSWKDLYSAFRNLVDRIDPNEFHRLSDNSMLVSFGKTFDKHGKYRFSCHILREN